MRHAKLRLLVLLVAVATIVLGLAARSFLAGLPAKVAGVALYGTLVYWLVLWAAPALRPRSGWLVATGLSFAVELAQLTPYPARSARHRILSLIFGTTFSAWDLPMYAAGTLLAAIVHVLLSGSPRRAARATRAVMARERETRLAYSTGGEKEPEETEEPSTGPRLPGIRLRLDRRASNRVVTVVSGLPGTADEIAALAKSLKAACGTGGTLKDGTLELQGDHCEAVERSLAGRGLKSKRAGG